MKALETVILTCILAAPAACHSTTSITSDAAEDSVPDVAPDGPGDPAPDTAPPPGPYVLHEWGVMAFDRGVPTIHGPTPAVAPLMAEKPVIYLYAEEEIELDLTVGFASGASREVWPLRPSGPSVDWAGLEVRPGSCDTTPFPTLYDNPWIEEYCEACTLGNCVVEDASCITYGDTVSKLLFYNGELPGYSPPLDASHRLSPDGMTVMFDVSNPTGDPVEGVWLLYRDMESTCTEPSFCPVMSADLAFAYLDVVEPGSGAGLELPVVHLEAELDVYGLPIPGTLGTWDEWEELPSELARALEERGLWEQEAAAFLDAWDLTFFGILGTGYIEPLYRNGAAVLYFMSREDYDAHLPLEASPPPADTVRLGMVYQNL